MHWQGSGRWHRGCVQVVGNDWHIAHLLGARAHACSGMEVLCRGLAGAVVCTALGGGHAGACEVLLREFTVTRNGFLRRATWHLAHRSAANSLWKQVFPVF
jgi:hypothetical protein